MYNPRGPTIGSGFLLLMHQQSAQARAKILQTARGELAVVDRTASGWKPRCADAKRASLLQMLFETSIAA
jgi:hypothetical protein